MYYALRSLPLLFPLLFMQWAMAAHTDASPEQNHCRNELMVLGVAQDAGRPQINNWQDPAWIDPSLQRFATALGVIDRVTEQRWLFEATPDIRQQLYRFRQHAPLQSRRSLDGVFLTHAHIGHYAGLIFFGKEAANTKELPLYVMPEMANYLSTNGPWDSLVTNANVAITRLENSVPVKLTNTLNVTPILVPHRREYSETSGFIIAGAKKRALFIPDIDSWEKLDKWHVSIERLINSVDIAYLDATFFSGRELPGRDMSKIPHPTISHSMRRFETLPVQEKQKIRFIHLNHSNPALDSRSDEYRQIQESGFAVAQENESVCLD